MEIIIGLIIIAIGSFCQSSSYVPIKKVKEWSWESFWLLQGVFAWLVFPLLGALLGIPQGSSLFDLWGTGGAPMSIFYGILWGVGGLTFGLSMRYLGVALGQSIALGTCAGFGTLFPAIFAGTNLFEGNGLILLLGVGITLSGIAIIGYAGSLRAKNMSEEEKRAVRHVQTRTTHRQDRQDSQPAHHGTVHRGADSQRSHLHERTPAYVGHLPCREERGAHSFLEQDFHLPEDSLGGRAQAAQEDSPVDTA